MPKDPKEERGRHERETREREEHAKQEHDPHAEGHERDPRPRRQRMGRDHAVHQEIVERRLGGGAPATPEAYANALEEWGRLPGAIMRPPTDEKPPAPAPKPADPEADKEPRP
jgi:hypothetical protein